ncbi:hypothetical protein NIES2098_47300 [Calothrix sp. NIES-2098]|nr:hypothetical protein NIES2098_47300 [Calothrix sp. NIES-2098]
MASDNDIFNDILNVIQNAITRCHYPARGITLKVMTHLRLSISACCCLLAAYFLFYSLPQITFELSINIKYEPRQQRPYSP